jgi:predicted dehydrogenase
VNILLVGLGSIGQRHLRNILGLGHNSVTIVKRSGVLPPEFQQLKVFTTIDEAVAVSKYNAAIICTPTAQHIADLERILAANIPSIYLEKPISHNYNGIEKVQQLISAYSPFIVVGYDLHFDPGMQKVKQLLQSNTIGNVISVNAQVGQYLPDWRPYEDHTHGMSAKKETGGGVMLDLVHEFDYLYWLFGKADRIACQYSNSGFLKIETEELAEVLIKFANGIIGTIHLDYLQRKLVRNCMITGTNGSIFWDLASSQVKWIDTTKQEHVFSYSGFERNERFIQIMTSFLNKEESDLLTTFDDALQSLQMVLAAKQSAEQNVFIQVN